MNSKLLQKCLGAGIVLSSVLAAAWNPSSAAEFWLRADTLQKTMPDDAVVTMWGFASDNAAFNSGAPATAPGPLLTVPPNDTTLTIHLRNNLGEATSLVIPGQTAAMAPVKFTDAQGRQRVRSFAAETAPGAEQVYTWTGLKPGTYLYHSGTHPAVQVQMGLYGGVKQDAGTAGLAYPGVSYSNEVVLFYSEIDPALHAAVADGSYGTPAYPSTVDYAPKYFLVNGKPYETGDPPLPAGSSGSSTLIRFLNAGLKSHVPVAQGLTMRLVAEDGKPYPYPKEQYSVLLPAAKTADATITLPLAGPAPATIYPVYDRALHLTNGAASPGGMLAFLSVANNSATPTAANDAYGLNEDTPLAVAAPGVLGNDTGAALSATLVGGASNGTLVLNGNGSFSYTPAANFFGTDSFSYKAGSGALSSNTATVTLTVNPVNDPPAAANNAYSIVAGGTLNVTAPGVLANDSDPDGNPLTAVLVTGPVRGALALNASGSFSYTPNAGAISDSFTYRAFDGALSSAPATVAITIVPNKPPVAVNDTAATRTNTAVTIAVLANDRDPDGTLNPASVTIVTPPTRGGTAVKNANGTVTFTPGLNFRGTDTFSYNVRDNRGATSNTATVRVNVTR